MTAKTPQNYIEGVGRRKTATARVRIYPDQPSKSGKAEVNGKKLDAYFPRETQQKTAREPFGRLSASFTFSARVEGGGLNAQAEAVRHGLTRALVKYNEEWRKVLKPYGYLTRDSRMKERKKPGLRGARRPQQWRKR